MGAHYRDAHRARSIAEFISRLEVALQELDETIYWLELMAEGGVMAENRLSGLAAEASELIAILFASVKRAKGS